MKHRTITYLLHPFAYRWWWIYCFCATLFGFYSWNYEHQLDHKVEHHHGIYCKHFGKMCFKCVDCHFHSHNLYSTLYFDQKQGIIIFFCSSIHAWIFIFYFFFHISLSLSLIQNMNFSTLLGSYCESDSKFIDLDPAYFHAIFRYIDLFSQFFTHKFSVFLLCCISVHPFPFSLFLSFDSIHTGQRYCWFHCWVCNMY